MSISFSVAEVVKIAISIEERGIAFYDIMATSSDGPSVKSIFQYLAQMEREHIQVFRDMFPEAGEYEVPKSYAEEYAEYFKALIDNAVFTDEFVTSEATANIDSDIKAIELAIIAEKESLLFYYEMKDILPSRAQETVNKIITEEKSHLLGLSRVKQTLATS